jgi:uncharacterized protein (DUF1330 family)
MPKGYVYAEVDITDPAGFETYWPLAVGSVESAGARGDPKVLEGDKNVRMCVLLEFESRERAHGDEYQAAIPLWLRSTTGPYAVVFAES